MSAPDQYAVIGNPIEHSLSPSIHAAFAQQLGESLEYTKQQVPLDQFTSVCEQFFKAGGKGLNVTVPFKTQAFEWAQALSESARLAQAVNTLGINERGAIWGDNTDGIGLVDDLENNLSVELSDKRILILGAGGAVRGVLWPLIQTKPKEICIANRSLEKAQVLARLYPDICSARALAELADPGNFDIVINGTSASLSEVMFAQLAQRLNPSLAKGAFCYDMMYGDELTPFLTWCQTHQAAQTADGFGMLVEQAAQAFYLWRGKRPDTETILKMKQTLIQEQQRD